ncbi:MAG TPA: hypothetical protein VFA52_03025 [Candidatus Paceibacterota bacterium]|nr:hypothetical protein [Candidatus Paceibacterota bacterium]
MNQSTFLRQNRVSSYRPKPTIVICHGWNVLLPDDLTYLRQVLREEEYKLEYLDLTSLHQVPDTQERENHVQHVAQLTRTATLSVFFISDKCRESLMQISFALGHSLHNYGSQLLAIVFKEELFEALKGWYHRRQWPRFTVIQCPDVHRAIEEIRKIVTKSQAFR